MFVFRSISLILISLILVSCFPDAGSFENVRANSLEDLIFSNVELKESSTTTIVIKSDRNFAEDFKVNWELVSSNGNVDLSKIIRSDLNGQYVFKSREDELEIPVILDAKNYYTGDLDIVLVIKEDTSSSFSFFKMFKSEDEGIRKTFNVPETDPLPVISISNTSLSGIENSSIALTFETSIPFADDLNIGLVSNLISANSNDIMLSNKVVFSKDQLQQNVLINLVDDYTVEAKEIFELSIQSVAFTNLSETPTIDDIKNTATVEIIDNDVQIADPLSISLSHADALVAGYTKSTSVQVSINSSGLVNPKKWCLSESQISRPYNSDSLCTGGQGSSNGWYDSVNPPTSFQLSTGDGIKKVYIWVANEGKIVNLNPVSASITLDTIAPIMNILNPIDNYIARKNSLVVSFNGNCSDDLNSNVSVFLSGFVNQSFDCSANAWTTNIDMSSLEDGNYRFDFSMKDAAGNTSSVLSKNIQKMTHASDPTMKIMDLTSLSQIYTNDRNVIIDVDHIDAQKWCVSENQSIAPLSLNSGSCGGGDWLSVEPTSFTLSNGDGLKKVYVWIADSYDGINKNQVKHEIYLDTTAPVINASSVTTITTNTNNFKFNGSCEANFVINVSGSESVNINCNNGLWTWGPSSISTDGNYNYALQTTDLAGNSSAILNLTYNFDTSASPAPSVQLAHSNYRNQLAQEIEVLSCNNTPFLLINESSQPLASDANWLSCSVGTLDYTLLSNTETTHTIKVWSKDHANNVSELSTNLNIIYDISSPVINITSLNSKLLGNGIYDVNFTVGDLNLGSSDKIKIEFFDTSNWNLLSEFAIGSGPYSPASYSYSWSVPDVSLSNVKLRISLTDLAGNNQIVESNTFEIDNIPPSLASVNLVTPALTKQNTSDIQITNCNAAAKVIFTLNTNKPLTTDSNWQNCVDNQVYSFNLAVNQQNDINIRLMDEVGNISDSQTVTVIQDSINPSLNLLTDLSSLKIRGGNLINLSFNSTDINGIKELSLYYSNDGSNFSLVSNALKNLTSHNFNLALDNTSSAKLKLVSEDLAGNIKELESGLFTVDSTAPVAPNFSILTSSPTNLSQADFQLSTCGDAVDLYYSLSNTTPSDSDPLWMSCHTGIIQMSLQQNMLNSINMWLRDDVGNISAITTKNILHDNISPSLEITNDFTINYFAGGSNLTIDYTASDANTIVKVELYYYSDYTTNLLLSDSLNTSAGSYSYTFPMDNTASAKFRIRALDNAGNWGQYDTVFLRVDSSPPIITLGYTDAYKANTVSEFSWNLTEYNANGNFNLRYFDGSNWNVLPTVPSGLGPHTNKAYSISFDPGAPTTNAIFEVSFTDLLGQNTTVQKNLIIDGSPPVPTSFSLNNAAASTNLNNVLVNASASDSDSKITYICMKYNDSTAPLDLSDSCWNNVPEASRGMNLSLSDAEGVYFTIGFVALVYDVYVWYSDAAGNISTNNATLGVDKASIEFIPGTPPEISNIVVANSDAPSNPMQIADLQFAQNQNMYVKWKASDAEGLSANPISVYYTTDDTNYILLQDSISNNINGGCTISPSQTGCTILAAPSSSYFKLRIIVKDLVDAETFTTSSSMNESKFRNLAGNTEKGINGNASSVVFKTVSNYNDKESYSLAVSDRGDIFVRDKDLGGNLIWVNPENGKATVLMPQTGVATGDGGDIANATFNFVRAINMDHNNRLLVVDYDRVRRIDLNTKPWTIETIIGGGSSYDPGSDVAWNEIKINGFDWVFGMLIPKPNGDIYFKSNYSENDRKFRHYVAAEKRVKLVEIDGQGFYTDETASWSGRAVVNLAIAYDPLSSALEHMQVIVRQKIVGDTENRVVRIDYANGSPTQKYYSIAPYDIVPQNRYTKARTGLDGKIYVDDRLRRSIKIYNHITNSYTHILGTSIYNQQPCEDGVEAKSCDVLLEGFFINAKGKIYFNDHGMIRTINDDGNIVTLAGAYASSGNGDLATSSRIGNAYQVEFGKLNANYDTFVINDPLSGTYREFTIGGNMNYVSDGVSTSSYSFSTDPDTGDIFDDFKTGVGRFVRATNSWERVLGNGGTWYFDPSADGLTGSELKYDWYSEQVLMFHNGQLFVHKSRWSGSSSDAMIKKYDATDSYRQSHFAGVAGYNLGSLGTAGGLLADSKVPSYGGLVNMQYDAEFGYIIKQSYNDRMIHVDGSGIIQDFTTLPSLGSGFVFVNKSATDKKVYYCNNLGQLREWDIVNSVYRDLSWDSPTMKCSYAQRKILYHPVNNSLIFLYHQNGLYGVGEYKLD